MIPQLVLSLLLLASPAYALRTTITVIGADGRPYSLVSTGTPITYCDCGADTFNLTYRPIEYYLDLALAEGASQNLSTTLGLPTDVPVPLVLIDGSSQETVLVQVFSDHPGLLSVATTGTVPEVPTGALLGAGLLSLVLWARRGAR